MSIKKINKILVPLDGSPNSKRGLDHAIFLARHSDGIITGIHVVPLVKPKPNDPVTSLEKIFLKKAASIMNFARTRCAKQGIMFEDHLAYGDEGPEIIRLAQKKNSDVIVIGSRGRSMAKEVLLGSTSNYVLHKTHVPIMIIK